MGQHLGWGRVRTLTAGFWVLFDLYSQELQYESLQIKQKRPRHNLMMWFMIILSQVYFYSWRKWGKESSYFDLQKGSRRTSTGKNVLVFTVRLAQRPPILRTDLTLMITFSLDES